MTMTISVMMDLLALLTAHVHLCYSVSCAIFRQQLRILSSLWNLFRGEYSYYASSATCFDEVPGKRYNVLRNRTDSWNYDVDQLLFGTILFTLMAFLFPTVVAYYILFTTVSINSFYGTPVDSAHRIYSRFVSSLYCATRHWTYFSF